MIFQWARIACTHARKFVAFAVICHHGLDHEQGPQRSASRVHKKAALLEQITAPIGRFRFATDDMRQGHLANFMREAGLFAGPVAEGSAEPMHGNCVEVRAPRVHFAIVETLIDAYCFNVLLAASH